MTARKIEPQRIELEPAPAARAFTAWDKHGVCILHTNNVNSVFSHRAAFFRRNVDRVMFRVQNRQTTEQIPAAEIVWKVAD